LHEQVGQCVQLIDRPIVKTQLSTGARIKMNDKELIYDYYKQQREEFMNLSRERVSVTLQFLVLLGALVAAFFQTSTDTLKLGIAGVMMILGIVRFIILRGIEKTMRLHVARARAARKAVGILEQFANIDERELPKVSGVRRDKFLGGSLFGSVYILLIIVGVIFALTVIVK
jgi:hypothetical protein